MSRSLFFQRSRQLATQKARQRRLASRASVVGFELLERRWLPSTWYVDSSNTSASPTGSLANPYETIQSAINVAGAGDTIEVETGNGYSEQDTVASQDNLTIEAYNGEPVVDASSTSGSGVGFTIDASVTGVTISGLTIEKFVTGVAIFGSATIGGTSAGAGNTISGSSGDGIDVGSGGTAAILGNSISGNSNGIELSGPGTTGIVVAGNTITSNTNDGVLIDNGASGIWIGVNSVEGSENATSRQRDLGQQQRRCRDQRNGHDRQRRGRKRYRHRHYGWGGTA